MFLTSNIVTDLILCIVIGVVGIYFYFTRNYNYWKKYGVKQATPSFPFGNIAKCLFAKETPDEFLQGLYNCADNEKIVGFYVLDRPYLMLRDTELIKHVLIKDFDNFSNRLIQAGTEDELETMNLFLIRNPPWNHIRPKLTPAFTTAKLKKMVNLMMEISKDFKIYLDSLDVDGISIEIKEVFGKFTTDLIGITAFGTRFNSISNENAEFRKYGKAMFASSYKRYLSMLSIFFVPQLRPFMKPKFFDDEGSKFFKRTFHEVINERIKSGNTRGDVIDLLIDIKKSQENDRSVDFKLEGDALVAQAAIFFSGGFESSSTTATWTLYELAKHPDIQTKVRNEILKGLEKSDGKTTYELITELPYLSMIVDEILRLYPILSFLDRLPENDYIIPGTSVVVKKGTPIVLPMRALHFDSKLFSEPEKFDPERFSDENKANITPCSYFPFGEGPRNCMGARLGLIQTKLCLIEIISKFEVEPCEETPIPLTVDKLNIFIQPPGGMYLKLRRYQK